MILTCEQCETRYLVASSAIGEEGRKVRCTNCGHEWFQNYEHIDAGFLDEEDDVTEDHDVIDAESLETEAADDLDIQTALDEGQSDEEGVVDEEEIVEDIEPIPEAVKPLREKDGERDEAGFDPRLMGYAAGILIFTLSVLALVIFKKPVISTWPPAIGLYDLVGMTPDLKGEGLILDRITAVADYNEDGVEGLVVSGFITNLDDNSTSVPQLMYQLKTADGSLYDAWILDPPTEQLAPQGEIRFQTRYPDLSLSIEEVAVKLVPEFL